MAIVSPYISIITLNIKKLNSPIKRHGMTEWIKEQDPTIRCLQEIHFSLKDTWNLSMKEWKKTFQANGNNDQKAGVDILIRQNRL